MAEMSLSEALRALPEGSLLGGAGQAWPDVRVAGVAHDSRRVRPGDVFVAWRGDHFDGRRFASAAVESGAVAVLADGAPPEDFARGAGRQVPWIETESPRHHMAALAAQIHGHPDRNLCTLGVTGTNGKTTVVCLLERLMSEGGLPCGRFGTLGYRFAEHDYGGERTTPEASDLFRLLEEMRELGARAAAMEVSSHALDQNRVGEMRFDVGVFTNLTRDHLDYHETMENYFAAKRRLFEQIKPGGAAVVGVDDEFGRALAEDLEQRDAFGVLRFGVDDTAAVRPHEVELDLRGIRGSLRTPRGALQFETPLIGRFNLLNVLAAVATCEVLRLDRDAMRRALRSQEFVPGRLHPVRVASRSSHRGEAPEFPVLIDFAHTPAALEAALESMREVFDGRILVVFGCGGEKDRGKRAMMGEAAGRLADLVIATSDNPRRESPEAILEAVVEGIERVGGNYETLVDRRQAIARALEVAWSEPGWSVLIAGKGHEREQVLGERRVPFDDRLEVEQKLEELRRAHVDA